jgi:uncharacterized protein (DUF305 family)
MSSQRMQQLADAPRDKFQDMWLRMMIEHHQGAIEMAQDEQRDGTFKPALRLARAIETAQEQEIATMEDLLD